MNIRSLSNPVTPVESQKLGETRAVRSEVSSEDRDADGRRQEQEPNKDQLSEDEMRRAREYLENLPGLKTNGLKIEVEDGGEYRVFVIYDRDGQVARRIVEWEMRVLLDGRDKKSGQIFDKAA